MKEYSLMEVHELTGIPYYRIYYAHYTGRLPEPRKVGRTRIYSDEDVERIRKHFAGKVGNHAK